MRTQFENELQELREAVLRMAGQVEAQIEAGLGALRNLDREAAEDVRRKDQGINEACRQIREQCFLVIATQQPVARDLRAVTGVQHIAIELERMGDYAVRLGRRTCVLSALPRRPLRAEFGLMGEMATQQVRDILDALIDLDTRRAVEVARRDSEIDHLYQRVFDDLIQELAQDSPDPDLALRAVTLIQAAHDLERLSDRVTNVAEDIVFLEEGHVVELR
jgi:phosphate transport system protein